MATASVNQELFTKDHGNLKELEMYVFSLLIIEMAIWEICQPCHRDRSLPLILWDCGYQAGCQMRGEQAVFMDNFLAHLAQFQMDIVSTGPKKRGRHHILSWSLPVPLSPFGIPCVRSSPGSLILATNPCFTHVWLCLNRLTLTAPTPGHHSITKIGPESTASKWGDTQRLKLFGCSRPAYWSLVHLKRW